MNIFFSSKASPNYDFVFKVRVSYCGAKISTVGCLMLVNKISDM